MTETEQPVAHETGALLRMSRGGMSMPQICHRLKMTKEQLQLELQLELDDEQDAHRRGVPIYDDRIIVCSKCGDAMVKETGAVLFKCPVCKIVSALSTEH